jgi:uncharacterized membrane protein
VIPSSWFPLLLVAHVTLAISLFLPAFLLPFTLRTRGRDGEPLRRDPGFFVGLLLWLETHGTVLVGAGVAITGLAMLAILGFTFLSQPWLLLALGIYAGVLITAFFVQRPGMRRLLRLPEASGPEEQERWRRRARIQRYVSYVMAGAIGLIGWLMMAKPGT